MVRATEADLTFSWDTISFRSVVQRILYRYDSAGHLAETCYNPVAAPMQCLDSPPSGKE